MNRSFLKEEIAKGRVIGLLNAKSLAEVHMSPFGVIPKGFTGKWCLIVNLSAPKEGALMMASRRVGAHYFIR